MATFASRLPGRHIWAIAFALIVAGFFLLSHSHLPAPKFELPGLASRADRPLNAYHETPNAHENFEFFLKQGLHDKADFVFILNGETEDDKLIPELPNVHIVRRPNKCFDLGAFGEVLLEDDLWKRYKRFITMNASIRGPFLPMYSRDCWSDLFLGRITDKVKLAGLTVNCQPRPHVQSMLFATDSVGMSILLDPELSYSIRESDQFGSEDVPTGLNICPDNIYHAVHSEIGITGLIRSQGYDVDVFMTAFHAAESFDTYCDEVGSPDDVLFEGKYFGTTVHPYEIVFMKANRGVGNNTMDDLTKWHLSRSWTSWDACKA